MTRALLVALFAAVVPVVAVAAPVPKGPPPPNPKTSAAFDLTTGKVVGQVLQVQTTVTTYQVQMVAKNVVVNGQNVVVNEAVTVPVQQPVTRSLPLQGYKATTADGKELDAEALEKKLGDGGPVVQSAVTVDPEWRKVFADDVVFLEPHGAGGNVIRGGVMPAPAVVRPAIRVVPAAVPPVAPPPPPVVEKKEEKK
jgi:hypothetical protein